MVFFFVFCFFLKIKQALSMSVPFSLSQKTRLMHKYFSVH